jgi:predicted membrane-bound dolichyl-phosphate-mannose-protein mannosyltransferase
MDFLLWYEEGPIGVFVRESLWGYPITLSCHAVGMATVMGIVIALNMRVMGFAKGLSVAAFDKLFIIGWIGFIINLISGLVLFAGTTTTYFFQGAFQLKIGAIVLGGILMKLVMNAVRSNKPQVTQKILALACIACWTTGLITGRLMAYLV